jgi:hypothetical protein
MTMPLRHLFTRLGLGEAPAGATHVLVHLPPAILDCHPHPDGYWELIPARAWFGSALFPPGLPGGMDGSADMSQEDLRAFAGSAAGHPVALTAFTWKPGIGGRELPREPGYYVTRSRGALEVPLPAQVSR